jgi:predicted aspartyl protease
MLGRRRRATLIVIGIAATGAPCGFASITSFASSEVAFRPQAGDVRIELQRDYLIAVRGKVGNRGGLTFVIDTGTLPTLVDARIARQFGKAGSKVPVDSFTRTNELESVVIPSLAVGPFSAMDVSALVADLSRLEPHFGIKADVVVGAGLLRGACFSIDYVRRRLNFTCRDGWRATLPLDGRSPHVVADVTIDGTSLRLVVDTGSQAVLVDDDATPVAWQSKVEAEIDAWDFSGPVRLRRLIADVIAVGVVTWQRRPVHILSAGVKRQSYDGVLGVRALGMSAVQFDLQRMVLSWNE